MSVAKLWSEEETSSYKNNKTSVTGDYKYSTYKDAYIDKTHHYEQTFTYDSIGNMTYKHSRGDGDIYKAKTDGLVYDLIYDYDMDYAHRIKCVYKQYYRYDENGNITGISDTSFDKQYRYEGRQINDHEWVFDYDMTDPNSLPPEKKRTYGYQRSLFYNDKDMMICSKCNTTTFEPVVYYTYDDDNKRTSKYNERDKYEVLTFNDYFTVYQNNRNKFSGGEWYKSIMLGNSRLVTRVDQKQSAVRHYRDERTFYYLNDHLGSATLITNYKGEIYQATEYTPHGERWLERTQNNWAYYLPFRFTGKPLDDETGYYYFGARYYIPRLAIWMSSDPAMSEYFDNANKGEGGIYNFVNLNTYNYGGNNPIKYTDPDGRTIVVSSDESYINAVEADLKKIAPSASVDRETGKVSVSDKIDKGHENGYKLLSTLINDDNTVKIKYRKNDASAKPNSKNAFDPNSSGADTDISFDHNINISSDNVDKSRRKKTDPSIVLGHELIHALHNAKGNNGRNEKVTQYVDLLGNDITYSQGKNTNREELGTVGIPAYVRSGDITENQLRFEQGANFRVRY